MAQESTVEILIAVSAALEVGSFDGLKGIGQHVFSDVKMYPGLRVIPLMPSAKVLQLATVGNIFVSDHYG